MKIASESINLIKDFMEAFSFDEMLHGTSLGEQKIKQNIDTPTRYLASPRINTLSPLREPVAYINESRIKSPTHLSSKKNFPTTQSFNNSFEKVIINI